MKIQIIHCMKSNVIGLICLILMSCNSLQKESPLLEVSQSQNIATQGIDVNVQKINPTRFQKQIISNGIIESSQKSELRFKTSEHLVKINVMNGQKVNKGQVLAQLDNEVILNQLNKAKIDLAKAETKLQEEKINYGLGSQEDSSINSYVLRNLHIKSGYLEAKNALENAQLLYEQTFLKSPISGVVANIEAKTGDFITSNDVFCTIVNQSSMEAVFSVSENEFKLEEISKYLRNDIGVKLNKNDMYLFIPLINTCHPCLKSVEDFLTLVATSGDYKNIHWKFKKGNKFPF